MDMAVARGATTSADDVQAFLHLVLSISTRLAQTGGSALAGVVDACLRDLIAFFAVDQGGIMEVQPDIRQARLRHVVALEGVPRAPTTLEYGALFPWTHAKTIFRGERVVLTCIDDFPVDATIDRASAAGLGLQSLFVIPVGIGGSVTHALCLTGTKPMPAWPETILARLQMVAQTFLAVLTRHNTERALQASERNLAEAQRIARIGSYVSDWWDDTLVGSEEANRIFGSVLTGTANEVLDLVHPDDRARVREANDLALARQTPNVELEYRIIRPDGVIRTVRSRIETAYEIDGTPRRTLATVWDVSELRAAEQESRDLRAELRHADRAAHAGTLTASLSHELNQPLTGILANAQAGLRGLGEDGAGPMREILEAIVRDDKRAAAVVDNLRKLLRREEPPTSSFDLGEACDDVVILFRSEFDARHVRLDNELRKGFVVCGVRTQIQQVMLNLLSNALHALQDRPVPERRLALRLVCVSGEWVEVRVSDTGTGIADDRLERVFDPFFTTRGEGLGMGLAISRSIVEAHRGTIVAEANPGGGTTLRFALRLESVAPVAGAGLPPIANAPTPVGESIVTVCVVDDDDAVRDGVVRLLAAGGWRAVPFGSAADALASPLLESAQCFVLDMQMPGMTGAELQRELARRGLCAPVVYLTARDDAATGVTAMKDGAFEYLAKPVDDSVLIDAVRRAVARSEELTRAARERQAVERRLATLTPRERDVLHCVIAGRLNKQIASDLEISEATVKQHRGQVMDKMQVRSVAELVRSCEAAGIGERSKRPGR
ncbi:MAG: response regulator [Proteobacteria bacterium]|jgi:PAS domain S-box-containing protein|nr:response regulator [Pseudomonadota bacterium]